MFSGPKAYVIPARAKDAAELTPNLRDADKEELRLTMGDRAELALQDSFDYSDKVWSVVCAGDVVAMFGVCPLSMLSFMGVPWLLCSDDFRIHRVEFLKQSKKYVSKMKEGYKTLENYVSADNKDSIKWLSHCGFTIHLPAVPYGLAGAPFYKFTLEVKDV